MYSKTAANAREVGSSTRLCQAQIMQKQTKQALEAKKGRYTYEHPHPNVTTDCVIFGFDGTVFNSPKKEAYLFIFNPDKYEELKQKGFRLEF